ncbi:MAG: hypothetical protein HZA54_05825, partial [Planctomycetes bacterium]|nr:hypothetical protein [Planctomycetota bacterium]
AGLAAVAALYAAACRALFWPAGWAFLVGFLPALPFALAAARRRVRAPGFRPAALRLLAAFTVFFWAAGLFAVWRTGPG